MSRVVRAALSAVLAAGVPATFSAGPAAAAADPCAGPAPAATGAGLLRAGSATARGLFVTYADRDTVLDGGTVVPPDLSSPLARAAIDRTGLGSATASPFYTPYSDAAGLPNAFVGTQLPLGSISEPSRAKVTGRPPQQQELTVAGGPGSSACARLAAGPRAVAAVLAGAAPDLRVGDVRAVTGPRGAGSASSSTVTLCDVRIGRLVIEQIVLSADAIADGAAGRSAASAVVGAVSLAGRTYRLTPGGLEPTGGGVPDTAALEAAGIELVSAGRARHSATGGRASASATGPVLRITSPDGRVLTLILGQAEAEAQLDRVD
jgi:hypothetical protein